MVTHVKTYKKACFCSIITTKERGKHQQILESIGKSEYLCHIVCTCIQRTILNTRKITLLAPGWQSNRVWLLNSGGQIQLLKYTDMKALVPGKWSKRNLRQDLQVDLWLLIHGYRSYIFTQSDKWCRKCVTCLVMWSYYEPMRSWKIPNFRIIIHTRHTCT